MAATDATTLPAYIIERNAQTTRAGLQIEKQALKDGHVTTWYCGTELQWRKSGFIQSRRFTFPRKSLSVPRLETFSPADSCGLYTFRLRRIASGEYRGSIVNELLPEWIESAGDGITAYAMRYPKIGLDVAYVGAVNALVESGIAPKEIDVGDTDERWQSRTWAKSRQDGWPIWEANKLPDGRYFFVKHVDLIDKQRAEHEERPPEFQSPEAYHAVVQRAAEIKLDVLQGLLAGRHEATHYGETTLSFDQETINSVNALMDDMLETIQDGRVVWTKKAATRRRQAAVVRADPDFSHFMKRALGNHASS